MTMQDTTHRLQNMSEVDRLLRGMVGGSLVLAAVAAQGDWYWLLLPGSVLLVTALLAYCPLYTLLGRRRRRTT
jgi:Flp pilus assembly protein TadB